jgi:acyl-CoA thioester hydrolase
MQTHHFDIRVYYEDTDAGGVVYHSNYLNFFERARTEWLRELGTEQDSLLEQSIGFVVSELNIKYHVSARFNQLLCIKTQVVKLARASLVFKQQLFDQQQVCLVSAQVKVACIHMKKMRPLAIPSNILEEFKRVI